MVIDSIQTLVSTKLSGSAGSVGQLRECSQILQRHAKKTNTPIFIVGHVNEIPRGALLLVSDVPVTPDGVKTEASDTQVTRQWANTHLEIGIESLQSIQTHGEPIKHFKY